MSSGDLALQRLEPSMLGGSWQEALQEEFEKPYFVKMNEKLASDRASENLVPIYPPHEDVFAWSRHCDIEDVKVVIIGQDPSPYRGVACGLSFSSDKPSFSLRVIFDEMKRDIEFEPPSHGVLTKWAERGVLLLNSALTVEHESPGSHLSHWKNFTDAVIKCVNDRCTGVVFMLWGNDARAKRIHITNSSHKVLEAYHPVSEFYPNSQQYHSFSKCGHFSMANEFLASHGKAIDWTLPEHTY